MTRRGPVLAEGGGQEGTKNAHTQHHDLSQTAERGERASHMFFSFASSQLQSQQPEFRGVPCQRPFAAARPEPSNLAGTIPLIRDDGGAQPLLTAGGNQPLGSFVRTLYSSDGTTTTTQQTKEVRALVQPAWGMTGERVLDLSRPARRSGRQPPARYRKPQQPRKTERGEQQAAWGPHKGR